jgi:hypothetical protein
MEIIKRWKKYDDDEWWAQKGVGRNDRHLL